MVAGVGSRSNGHRPWARRGTTCTRLECTMQLDKLEVRKIGPIEEATLEFGGLTVFTGPQASGKSIALQLLKLAIDNEHVLRTMVDKGLIWKGGTRQFFDLYLGSGMQSVWNRESSLRWQGEQLSLRALTRPSGPEGHGRAARTITEEQALYIPAQRMLCFRDGATRPFGDYRAGDPYVLREFSQHVHDIVHGELSKGASQLFPKPQRLDEAIRDALATHVFGGWQLSVDTAGNQRELVLTHKKDPAADEQYPLRFLSWSAGQREFVPLLIGIYELMPAGAGSRRDPLRWAIIEEPESGLHPRAIGATMALVYELIRREYRVVLSTHSTHVLDVVWGLRAMKEHGGGPDDALKLIELPSGRRTRAAGAAVLEAVSRVYYFERGSVVADISALDPFSERQEEASWGGLTAFADNAAQVVAGVVQRSQVAREGSSARRVR